MRHLSVVCIFALIFVSLNPPAPSAQSSIIEPLWRTALSHNSLSVPAGQWRQVGRVGSGLWVLTIFAHGGALYVGASGGGVFRSTDQGRTWIELNAGITAHRIFGRSASAFVSSGNILFVGTSSGVYRLNSQGDGWTPVNNGLPADFGGALPVDSLAVSGTTLFASVAGPIIIREVYRSGNQGQTWERADDGLPGALVFGAPRLAATESTVLAAMSYAGIYRSTDLGGKWTLASAGLENYANGIVELATLDNDFFAAIAFDGIYRSTDQGQSWTKVSNLKLQGRDRDFAGDQIEAAGSNLLATSDEKVFLSIDRGQSWTLLADNATSASFSKLAVIGNQIFTSDPDGNIYVGAGFLPTPLACVSAASYSASRVAPESIVTAFGVKLATGTQSASTLPLPTSLAGTRVMVRDSAGVERLARLFFVSPGQVNYLVPEGVAIGAVTVAITSGDGSLAAGALNIASPAPGLFTANADGQGVPAGLALRIRAVGPGSFEAIAQLDGQNRFVPAPIELGPPGEQVYLILFGTGLRRFSAPLGVTAKIGGVDAPVTYAGAQGDLAGLDQINILLPRNLAGRGEVEVALTADNSAANMVKINLK